MFSKKLKYNSEGIWFQNTHMSKHFRKNQNMTLNNMFLTQMKNSFWNNQNRSPKYKFLEHIPKQRKEYVFKTTPTKEYICNKKYIY